MAFGIGRGVALGNPRSSMISNTVVDAVLRALLEVVYGPQEGRHSIGWAEGYQNLVFFKDGGRIAGRDHI